MRISTFKRYTQDDYPGSPEWFWGFLGNLNLMVDTLNPLLQGNVDIDNNLLAERQTVSLSHNVPVTIKMRKLSAVPRLVRLGYASGYPGVAFIAGYNSDGTLQVGVFFLGTPPTSAISCTLVFEP